MTRGTLISTGGVLLLVAFTVGGAALADLEPQSGLIVVDSGGNLVPLDATEPVLVKAEGDLAYVEPVPIEEVIADPCADLLELRVSVTDLRTAYFELRTLPSLEPRFVPVVLAIERDVFEIERLVELLSCGEGR